MVGGLIAKVVPKTIPEIYKQLLAAYRICVKNKPQVRRTPFNLHHESILAGVAERLADGTWSPGVSTVFVVTRPKSREVVAAQISDRVVHHTGLVAITFKRSLICNASATRGNYVRQKFLKAD